MMKENIKIIICDDHPFINAGLQAFINSQTNMTLIESTTSLTELYEKLKLQTADILILDINLPDGNGIESCKEIKQQYPNLKIIALSNLNERSIILQMVQNGASSYILKSAPTEELSKAISEVYRNGFFFNYETQQIISNFEEQKNQIPPITQREKEVLLHLAQGLSSAEIADKMHISPQTIATYRKSLLQKFNTNKTVSLLVKAKEMGYIS